MLTILRVRDMYTLRVESAPRATEITQLVELNFQESNIISLTYLVLRLE